MQTLPLSSAILVLVFTAEAAESVSNGMPAASTCGSIKHVYKQAGCCGSPDRTFPFQVVPEHPTDSLLRQNPCAGKKEDFPDAPCFVNDTIAALEQAGADVTEGNMGNLSTNIVPITQPYWKAGLCPVNVHWHLGAEHRSQGQYDENGRAPVNSTPADVNPNAGSNRRLADNARYGFACHHYNAADVRYTTEYDWQHCVGMHVGETYEVHWPHSALGACSTPYQYQTPFYDGVFCGWNTGVAGAVGADLQNLASSVGVQAQVFTIINDENFYFPDLMRGAIRDGDFWSDVVAYSGSTTGTSRDNTICSSYTPITWQVDRKCHLISASTFDKMCADMKQQADDMSDDLYAHGAREVVLNELKANNMGPAEPWSPR